jgi:PAS domain S-box-containing protein
VIQVINKKKGTVFNTDDEDLLRAFSSQIAVTLENAQLYEMTLDMKNYLESIHQSITNSILTLDNDYRVVTANHAALNLLDESSDTIVKRDFREILGAENRHIVERIDDLYASHRSIVDYDIEMTFSDDRKHSLNLNFLPLIDHKGDYQGVVLVFEDISREKRMKRDIVFPKQSNTFVKDWSFIVRENSEKQRFFSIRVQKAIDRVVLICPAVGIFWNTRRRPTGMVSGPPKRNKIVSRFYRTRLRRLNRNSERIPRGDST